MTARIYRIAEPAALAAASTAGVYAGTALDRADGFIHCSALDQLAGTLAAHFDAHERLAIAEIDAAALGAALKWEVSRGGERFPHVHGDIPFDAITAVHLIRRDEDGAWRLPEALCP